MNAETPVRVRVANVADAAALARLGAATFVETFGPMYQAEPTSVAEQSVSAPCDPRNVYPLRTEL